MVFVVVVAMYISSGVFLLWLFAELCGAHFVVAFHCYCCRCCCLVLGFYFVFTLSTSLEFQFTLLLLFRAVTLPLCSLTHTEASKRARERGAAHTDTKRTRSQILLSHAREPRWAGERNWVGFCAFPHCTWFAVAAKVALFAFVFLFSYLSILAYCISTFLLLHLYLFWRRCGFYFCSILVCNTCIANFNFILLQCGQ